jgi:ABC-type methionine transport system ATPase subunit
MQILVTHHVDMVLPEAGYLVHMTDGRIDSQGTISELHQRGILKEIIAESKKEKDRRAYKTATKRSKDGEADDGKGADMHKKVTRLVEEEELAEGRVKSSVYYSYIKTSYVLILSPKLYSLWLI